MSLISNLPFLDRPGQYWPSGKIFNVDKSSGYSIICNFLLMHDSILYQKCNHFPNISLINTKIYFKFLSNYFYYFIIQVTILSETFISGMKARVWEKLKIVIIFINEESICKNYSRITIFQIMIWSPLLDALFVLKLNLFVFNFDIYCLSVIFLFIIIEHRC